MDDARIAKIRGRLETATTGPKIVSFKRCDEGRGIIIKDTTADMGIADREFYAHAPADIRALLDRVGELEALALRQHEMLRDILVTSGADLSALLSEGRKTLGVG